MARALDFSADDDHVERVFPDSLPVRCDNALITSMQAVYREKLREYRLACLADRGEWSQREKRAVSL